MKKVKVLNQLADLGLVAVVRGESSNRAIEVSDACISGGVKAIEITYTLSEASNVISDLKNKYKEVEDVVIGAGTVLDCETARLAILSGADFIVSPSFDSETARLCNRYHIPYIPGCMSITEIVKASESGCDVIKLFPSRFFTPDIIKDIKAPIPNIEIMPSGGIDLTNIEKWFEQGALCAGIGGQLTNGTVEEITAVAQEFTELVGTARKSHESRSVL